MSESLAGIIERVTFHNPDNGFSVLKVHVEGRNEPVAVLCTLTMVTPGEHLEATGKWVLDRDHGRQFQADKVRTTPPETPAGIERFLGSGAIKGLGPGLAARIVALYKERSLEILDQFPEVLRHIRGIGADRLRKVRASWEEQKSIREIMLFLQTHGIGPARAVRIYKTYGAKSVSTIRENPYCLAADVRGIGFKTADELARKLGMDPRSPHRVRAAVRYALQELTSSGHCGTLVPNAIEQTVALVGVEPAAVETAVEFLVDSGELTRETLAGQTAIYLTGMYKSETGLAASVQRLANAKTHPLPQIDVEAALTWVEGKLKLQLAEAQREAIRQACRHNVVVITGGPGVGKTTLVRSLLEIFAAKKLRCVLAAPTGRAARRLAESSGRQAQTMHRLLAWQPAGQFQKNHREPLAGDLFVFDESSMVDVVLGNQLLRAIPTGACVVMVGDVDQLPSVGPGTVLADLIASRAVPVVKLTQIFRQAQHSRIIAAAHAIHQGERPEPAAPGEELSDFYFAECEDPQALQSLVVKLVRERIPERFGLDPLRDIQVLSPMNRGLLGTRQLNAVLQATLNPDQGQPAATSFGTLFRAGDRVIQTENNYDRDVFNGDMGTVAKVDPEEQQLTVAYENQTVTYDFNDLDELSLAYVLTIHKSQGSEYPAVVIPVHTQHFVMLQRNLIYTGVTRGKKLVVLAGSKRALDMAIERQETSQRFTRLRERLAAPPDDEQMSQFKNA